MPKPPDSILIRHLAPKNLLSFGPDNAGIELKALNLFIGPNGSGKSNLIEAIGLMRSTPRNLRDTIREGGGVAEWIWKGGPKEAASVEWVVRNPESKMPLRHVVAFRADAQRFCLDDERVEDAQKLSGKKGLSYYHGYKDGEPVAAYIVNESDERGLAEAPTKPDRSILAQLRDPFRYPELSWLAQSYEKVRIYREWVFGRNAVFREPQKADMRNDVLEEDFSNLGLFLSRIGSRFPVTKKAILNGLKHLYEGVTDFNVHTEGGTVQVFFTEGDFVIPATRLSDGTLRYLCLLAILCDPEPPPLICIEEPELGLHPDILPKVADLLRAASERTQLIVTTHSDILVDAMTEIPEAVVVCSKQQGQTTMERLNPDALSKWLKKYRLGQLWTKGEIGGTRW
jgi:predicted ATPase